MTLLRSWNFAYKVRSVFEAMELALHDNALLETMRKAWTFFKVGRSWHEFSRAGTLM